MFVSVHDIINKAAMVFPLATPSVNSGRGIMTGRSETASDWSFASDVALPRYGLNDGSLKSFAILRWAANA